MATEIIEYVIKVEGGQAVTDVGKLADKMQEAGNKAEELGTKTKAAASATDTLSQGAGKTERSLNQMAGALGIVSPGAANVARNIGDAAGALELFAAGGASVLRILGPIAIAVTALGLAYKALADDAKEAEDRMRAASAAATDAERVANVVAELRLRNEAAQGQPGSDVALRELEAQKLAVSSIDTAGFEAASAAVSKLQAELSNAQARLADTAEVTAAWHLVQGEIEQLTAGLESARGKVQQFENQIAGVREGALALSETQANERAAEEAARAQAEALREQEAAAKRAAAAEKERLELGKNLLAVNKEIAESMAPIGVIVPVQEPEQQVVSVSRAGQFVDETGRTIQITQGGTPTGATVTQQGIDVGGILGGAGAGLSAIAGGPGALLPAFGPVGAAVGGLAAIGELGAEGVEDQFQGFLKAIMAGLEALPEILSEVIPDFVQSLITDFLPALLDALPEIIAAGLVGLPAAIAEGIASLLGVQDFGGGGVFGVGGGDATAGRVAGRVVAGILTGGLSEVGIRAFQTGGEVDRTGFALVHRGEHVEPASGAGAFTATSRRGRFMGGGGGINLDLSGAFIGQNAGNEILRILEETIGPGGTGSTTIPGLAGRAGI